MSNQIDIVLALRSAQASAELNKFLSEAEHGLKHFVTEMLGAFVGLEGLHKIFDIQKDVLQLQESIGKLSQITGLSVETIVAMRTAAVEVGIPFDTMRTSLGLFSQRVYEAATSGGKMADAFRIMKVSLQEFEGGPLRSTDAIFKDFLIKFAQMPDGPQKTAFAMDVMGRSARDVIPLLNAASQAMGETGRASPISEASVAAATEFNRTIREVSEAVENLFISMANGLLPTMVKVAEQILELTRNGQENSAMTTALVATFKGLVTLLAITGLAFYDLGKFIGQDVNLIVDNFNVAIETCKNLLRDLAQFLADDARLVLDFVKSVFTASEVKDALLTGHFGTAKDIIVAQFEAIKGDVLRISGDIGGGVSDVFAGVAKGTQNTLEMTQTYAMDLLGEWNQLSGFLKDLWNTPQMQPQAHGEHKASPVTVASGDNIKNLSTLQALLAAIYKQDVELIEADPFKSQLEKVRELLPLLERQKEIVLEEYAAAQSQLNNPNLSEQQRLTILKDLVKLQGELNALEQKEQSLRMKGDFVGQMQAGLVKLNDRVTDFSTNAAQLSLTTMQRMVDGVSESIYAAMMHTKNWGEAFSRAMGQAVQGIIQMVAQWIAGRLAMMAVDLAFSATSKANSASTTAAAVPAGIAQAGAQGGWVGVLIYVGVFLAAMAALLAITSAVARERGGPVSAGSPYIVGEKRAELFIPDQSGFILPEVPSGAASGGSQGGSQAPINLHFHGGEQDAMKAMRSTDGQNFIIDLNRKSAKRTMRL